MKELLFRAFAYILAGFFGLSFYFTIFKLFQFNAVLGIALVSVILFLTVFLVLEKDFIKETSAS